jgi:hypothetical protein
VGGDGGEQQKESERKKEREREKGMCERVCAGGDVCFAVCRGRVCGGGAGAAAA